MSEPDATFCHGANRARTARSTPETLRDVEQAQALANCASQSVCKAAIPCLHTALSVLNGTNGAAMP